MNNYTPCTFKARLLPENGDFSTVGGPDAAADFVTMITLLCARQLTFFSQYPSRINTYFTSHCYHIGFLTFWLARILLQHYCIVTAVILPTPLPRAG